VSDQDASAGAPFEVRSSERVFAGHVVSVRVDQVRDPDGREATREVVEHPGAVAGLVVDDDGRILLVDQWRQALGRRVLEIPAGKYDVDGETVEAALRRELAEELGVEGGRLTWLTTFATTPGWSDELVDLFLVQGARPIEGERPPGDWEEAGLEVVAVDFDEALRRSTGERAGDGKTLVALGLYGLLRAGVWAPDPAGAPPPDAPARRAAARRMPKLATEAGGGQGRGAW
jgi:8-oxo-dGTP pyrophosphatase MutT (NUDIX family)